MPKNNWIGPVGARSYTSPMNLGLERNYDDQAYPNDSVEPVAFLIEDSVEIRESLIPALQELASTKVAAFADTEVDALNWLRDHPLEWHIAVVDLFLKEGSGLGVLALSGPRQPHQRMVVLTNYATKDMRERCIKLGADAVFDKSNELDAFFDYCIEQFRSPV